METDNPLTLNVKILSPTQVHYTGLATSVSATNKVGPFDVLPKHANFFSLLTKSDIVVKNGSEVFTFPISQGIIRVHNNVVTLFVDIEPAYIVKNTT